MTIDDDFMFLQAMRISPEEDSEHWRGTLAVSENREYEHPGNGLTAKQERGLERRKKRDIENLAMNGTLFTAVLQRGVDIDDLDSDTLQSVVRLFLQRQHSHIDMVRTLREMVRRKDRAMFWRMVFGIYFGSLVTIAGVIIIGRFS